MEATSTRRGTRTRGPAAGRRPGARHLAEAGVLLLADRRRARAAVRALGGYDPARSGELTALDG